MPASASSDAGRSRAICASVASWKTTKAGRLCSRATSARQAFSAAKRCQRLGIQRQRRRLVLAACGRRLRAPRRAAAPRAGTRSSSCTSPRSTSRELSVSASVLYSPSARRWPERDQLAQHDAPLLLARGRRRCRRSTAGRGRAARPCRCALPRSTSIRWTGAEAHAAVLLEAVDAATAPCAPPRWRPRSAGGCRQLSQLPQGWLCFAEVGEQPHAAAVVRLGQRQQRVELAALQALEVLVGLGSRRSCGAGSPRRPGRRPSRRRPARRRGRRGRSPGSSPRCSSAGRGGRRSARRACRCPCRRRWWPP